MPSSVDALFQARALVSAATAANDAVRRAPPSTGSDAQRSGRETLSTEATPIRGTEQRLFLACDGGLGIMDLTELNLAVAE